MIFHISIPTRNPENVAKVIAELWGGAAFPFFPHRNESWVAFAGDDRNSAVECYPQDALIAPSEEEFPTGFQVLRSPPAEADQDQPPRRSAVHAAVATPLTQAEVVALGEREGWLTRFAQRGMFNVVELWIENAIMFEVLPAEQQAEYLNSQTLDSWHKAVAAFAARQAETG